MRGALLTDLYELNMAASYLRRGMDAPATFSLYVRSLPSRRGFLVAAGLASCLGFLEDFGFDAEELGLSARMSTPRLVSLAVRMSVTCDSLKSSSA